YSSNNNEVSGNTASNNLRGIELRSSSNYNMLYHNNIINNTIRAYDEGINTWDNGAEGNYWSDYKGEDDNGDGIGDTLLPHLGLDYYPLVDPWSLDRVFEAYVLNNVTYYVTTRSNSTIASFNFNHTLKQISFNVTGPSGTTGFCNVTIPKHLITGDSWAVKINETNISHDITIVENSTHTFLYFTYSFSTHTVKIRAIDRSTELFPLWITGVIIAAMGIGVVITVFRKRRRGEFTERAGDKG
ncbi:MAG: NosD domain-containing protein, partial [Candidatus Bathyarchaeia archaeon]